MTATEIIREIDSLPPADRAVVMRYKPELEKGRQLTPEELKPLLDRFVEATDPAEKASLNAAIVKGFYGRK